MSLICNRIIQKIFFCFKINPDDRDTVNKIEELSDKILDAVEHSAKALNDATFSAIEHTHKVPPPILNSIHECTDQVIHGIRERVDANIGNEELQLAGMNSNIEGASH